MIKHKGDFFFNLKQNMDNKNQKTFEYKIIILI